MLGTTSVGSLTRSNTVPSSIDFSTRNFIESATGLRLIVDIRVKGRLHLALGNIGKGGERNCDWRPASTVRVKHRLG